MCTRGSAASSVFLIRMDSSFSFSFALCQRLGLASLEAMCSSLQLAVRRDRQTVVSFSVVASPKTSDLRGGRRERGSRVGVFSLLSLARLDSIPSTLRFFPSSFVCFLGVFRTRIFFFFSHRKSARATGASGFSLLSSFLFSSSDGGARRTGEQSRIASRRLCPFFKKRVT